jgi:hypothetical protein
VDSIEILKEIVESTRRRQRTKGVFAWLQRDWSWRPPLSTVLAHKRAVRKALYQRDKRNRKTLHEARLRGDRIHAIAVTMLRTGRPA